jgi:GDP-L-fucose synthase
MKKDSKIYVAGHTGLVGSAIIRKLIHKGYENLIGKTFSELDLRNQLAVKSFFNQEKPEYVFLAAAKVGGIWANNTYPAEFIYDNLMIESNVIHSSFKNKVKKLLFLGSSCIYPKNCPQPIKEEYLLTGPLEQTNEAYALAKISGLKLCEYYRKQYGCDFISAMPTNLYGPGDNFDLNTSHVLPAILRKMHLAKCLESGDFKSIKFDLNKRPIDKITGEFSNDIIIDLLKKYGIIITQNNDCQITLWGSGSPKREFLSVEDLVEAILFLMNNYSSSSHINIGVGNDITIKELSSLIKTETSFKGKITWDKTKLDGTHQKRLNVEKINNLGWNSKTNIKSGIAGVYNWYKNTKLLNPFK